MQWLMVVCLILACASASASILKPDDFKHYVDEFNTDDPELCVQRVPNSKAWDWMKGNVPFFECPDSDITRAYYFRWWTYRKHVKKTPDGFIITEFLPSVGWAGKHNSISCAAGHHIYEGRWLRDPQYLDDYSVFWFRKGGEPRRYSFWAADSILKRYYVTGDSRLAIDLLSDLIANYKAWESDHLDETGLFWQIDDRDGMEVSIGGSGCRATINSYIYGDALAIAEIADLADKPLIAREFRAKAAKIKKLVQSKLWDADAEFFKVLPRGEGAKLADVREEHGLTPWYFDLPDARFSFAWKQIMDPRGFYAPYGPTTAEQRHPKFAVAYEGHHCQWNGPSWPYSTSVTLTGMANLLNDYRQSIVSKTDYLDLLRIYAKCHQITLADGRVIPWIDENLNPLTGDWLSRTMIQKNEAGKYPEERGKDYNHSTFCDLVITGLVGLRPSPSGRITLNPLVPSGTWDYFCLDNIPYHGHTLTIFYDKTGERYHRGKGLCVLSDGVEIARRKGLGKVQGRL